MGLPSNTTIKIANIYRQACIKQLVNEDIKKDHLWLLH